MQKTGTRILGMIWESHTSRIDKPVFAFDAN